MTHHFKFALFIALVLCIFVSPSPAAKKQGYVDLRGFDKFVNRIIQEWEVPGVSVALVKDGRVLLTKGYGLRNVEKNLPVTGNTLFAIGSCTKAFTATAVGILVDDGKLAWDKPVRSYLLDFNLQDPVATNQMTAVDLMCHRSGLPRHDFSWYGAEASRQELYERLQHLEPTEPFRSTFQYNNFMFMTAGILVEKVSGKKWEAFIAERLFEPLGMTGSNFSVEESKKTDDFSLAYSKEKEKVTAIPLRNIDAIAPAGAINSSAVDMAKWLQLNLRKGKWGEKQIIKEATLQFIHTPQMVTGATYSKKVEFLYGTYGLGWGLGSYRGAPVISHGGGIDGFISTVALMPRQNAGLVVLTNNSSTGGYVTTIIGRHLYDRILGQKPVDWNSQMKEQRDKMKAEEEKAKKEKKSKQVPGTSPSHPLKEYCGRFHNPGYGIVTVKESAENLFFVFNRINYAAIHYHYDTFKITAEIDEELSYLANFITDPTSGAIQSLSIPLQNGVKDIVFTRMADEKMRDPKFLGQFVGEYKWNEMVVAISLTGDMLKATIPGQPVYELEPLKGTEFALKKLTGYSIEFIKDKAGKVIEAKIHQPDGVYTAKKIK